MAVRAYTERPEQLLSSIVEKFAEGAIRGWKIDEDGDLTLTSDSFSNKAWMRPKVVSDKVLFNIVGRDGELMSTHLYAVYHGRLILMLLTHFDAEFKTASATAMPTSGDYVPD